MWFNLSVEDWAKIGLVLQVLLVLGPALSQHHDSNVWRIITGIVLIAGAVILLLTYMAVFAIFSAFWWIGSAIIVVTAIIGIISTGEGVFGS